MLIPTFPFCGVFLLGQDIISAARFGDVNIQFSFLLASILGRKMSKLSGKNVGRGECGTWNSHCSQPVGQLLCYDPVKRGQEILPFRGRAHWRRKWSCCCWMVALLCCGLWSEPQHTPHSCNIQFWQFSHPPLTLKFRGGIGNGY